MRASCAEVTKSDSNPLKALIPIMRSILLLAIFLFCASPAALAEETIEQRLVISVERIWDRAGHSAFTDLVRFQDHLYCTFREGTGHIPGQNGVIRVIRSADGMNWESVALLEEPHIDLRDPKISITPDHRLMLNMGASEYHGSKRVGIESRVAFSDVKGIRFSHPQKAMLPEKILTGFDWLWRVTWHEGWAWGCVQQVPPGKDRSLHLVRSRDGIHFEQVTQLGVDHPTETTLRFQKDSTMLAMIRRTGNSPNGWIGLSKPPYTDWKFQETNKRFGGPNLLQLPEGSWLAGSRGYGGKSSRMELWGFDPKANTFQDILALPSGGDTSYPGFVVEEKQNRVWVSYYSSHEGKAAIYLATLRLDALVKNDEQTSQVSKANYDVALIKSARKTSKYTVTTPPASMKLPDFYRKYVDASGYPIVSSGQVNDYALKEAAYLVDLMLAKRPDVRKAMVESGSRLIVVGYKEFTTDIPEYTRLKPKDYWDVRARGLGGSRTDPVCSCGEENLLAYEGDPYRAENILIHEFAHNIHLRGMVRVDKTFDERLKKAYDAAMANGLWAGVYASTNHHEYFAEGVQSWFNNNRPPDHDHNHVDTRKELREYDPGLAALCEEVFGDTKLVYTKPTTRLTGHLVGYNPKTAPKFQWPEHLQKQRQEIRKKAEARRAKANRKP